MEALNHIDHDLFLFLNGKNNAFFDAVMFQATKSMLWIPLYVVFLYLLFRHYKWKTLIILVIAAIMILVSDQLANLFKDTIQRLRPSHEPGLTVHLVNAYKGGQYGFYSSHASNTFAIAFFLIALLGDKIRWFSVVALLWCSFTTYSRIYLGVHFPGDLLAGIVMGSLLGYSFGKLTTHFFLKQKSKPIGTSSPARG